MADEKTISQQAEEPVRPFVRFWARSIDKALYLATLPLLMALPGPLGWLLLPLWLGGLVALEALLLSSFGTTPGKAILGVSVRNSDGKRLSFRQALNRTIAVYRRGHKFGIVTIALAYKKLKQEGRTAWDDAGNFVVRHQALGRGRMVAGALTPAAATMFLLLGPALSGPKSANADFGGGAAAKSAGPVAASGGGVTITPTGKRKPTVLTVAPDPSATQPAAATTRPSAAGSKPGTGAIRVEKKPAGKLNGKSSARKTAAPQRPAK